jgi:hypothetical protein
MRAVEVGMRSTLWACADGSAARQYHDTGAWSTGAPPPGAEERAYAGRAPPRRPAPAHLRRALGALVRAAPADVRALAAACGVSEATAWCYAAQVVERWPEAHVHARALVHPPALAALAALDDASGPLRALMARAEATPPLRGDVEWRCLDRYAHLRLARLCLQAAGELP